MKTTTLAPPLALLFGELIDGPASATAYMLNTGDAGLLRSLDRLSAAEASATVSGGGSVAAHTDHLRYGLSLMNRWATGDDAYRDADWGMSWRLSAVSDDQWKSLRAALASEAHRWRATLATPRDVKESELSFMIASIAHLAYHLGAIRQIARTARGPADGT
ncbi:MAG TPA: hypothetical protein VII52_00260 [Gemmatimonadaceae bacterium]